MNEDPERQPPLHFSFYCFNVLVFSFAATAACPPTVPAFHLSGYSGWPGTGTTG
jgi:hypothetical protein